jgi:hypothetical protein
VHKKGLQWKEYEEV